MTETATTEEEINPEAEFSLGFQDGLKGTTSLDGEDDPADPVEGEEEDKPAPVEPAPPAAPAVEAPPETPAPPAAAAPAPAEGEYTAEERASMERAALRAQERTLEQAKREFERRNAVAFESDEERKRREERDAARERISADLPDVQKVIDDKLDGAGSDLVASQEQKRREDRSDVESDLWHVSVASAHPDLAAILADNDPKTDGGKRDLEAWIKSLPFEQASPLMKIYLGEIPEDKGWRDSAQDTNRLLREYKTARGFTDFTEFADNGFKPKSGGARKAKAKPAEAASPTKREQLEAAAAVPSAGSEGPAPSSETPSGSDQQREFRVGFRAGLAREGFDSVRP